MSHGCTASVCEYCASVCCTWWGDSQHHMRALDQVEEDVSRSSTKLESGWQADQSRYYFPFARMTAIHWPAWIYDARDL